MKKIAYLTENNFSNEQHIFKTIRENNAIDHLQVSFFTAENNLEKFKYKNYITQFDAVITSKLKVDNLKTYWEEEGIIDDSLDLYVCRSIVILHINTTNFISDIVFAKISRSIAAFKKYFRSSTPRLALLYGDKNLKYNVNQLTQKFITEFVPTFALFNTDFKSTYYGNKFDIFVHFSNKKENPALDYFDGLKAKVEMEFSPILIEALEDTENNEIYFNQALYLANDMLKNADEYAEITKKPLKFSLKRENNEFKAF